MTNPPPPGNWGPPQPGAQPPYGQGQPQYGRGQWPPQQPGWGTPPTPPKNNGLKFLLIGVAVLLIIAISVGATLLFTRDVGDVPTTTANPPPTEDIASANDTQPVSIITEDPTCEPWRPINNALVAQQKLGWGERDYSVPATLWTADQRKMHQEMAAAMQTAADQTIALAKMTPHRVMRELYEQSIAYWRAYSESISDYTVADNSFAVTASDTSGAIVAICAAIDYRSAATRGPLIPPAPSPSSIAPAGDPAKPTMFVTRSAQTVCSDWQTLSDKFDADTKDWRESDTSVPATEWTPERRAIMNEAEPRIREHADEIQALGSSSGNAQLEDFAMLSAQYFRAYADAIPTYTSADGYLSAAASYASFAVFNACAAVRR